MRSPVIATAAAAAAVLLAVVAYWGWSARAAAERSEQAIDITAGNPDRAIRLMVANGCAGCHQIPGVPMARGRVGPSLANIRAQAYIGGILNNTPDNLVRWIASARDINPRGAMPNIALSEQEARDIAAYLYLLP